jgi:hypothetical protein
MALLAALALALGLGACSDEGSPAVRDGGDGSGTTTAGGAATTTTAAPPRATTTTASATKKADYTVKLTGANEVPGPGAKNGSGTALITLVPDRGEVCFEITVKDIGQAKAAHLHRAAKGASGDVVLNLSGPFDDKAESCAAATTLLVDEIKASPDQFYVNVHTEAFPDGAIRGQLK